MTALLKQSRCNPQLSTFINEVMCIELPVASWSLLPKANDWRQCQFCVDLVTVRLLCSGSTLNTTHRLSTL
jgi:hypothetical protein